MTTPVERMRAIAWGRELLTMLQADPAVPEDLKQAARRLQATYPRASDLLKELQHGGSTFPTEAVLSIEPARPLFENVQARRAGSPETQLQARFTLRHFPLRRWAGDLYAAALSCHVDDWLAPDP